MRSGLRWMGALGGLALLGGCAASGHHAMPDVYDAHEDYVTAINANDVDAVMAMLTDDVVFMAPHEPRLVGKAAVRPWAEGYLAAYTIHWTKTTLEFVVSGDWAFEQYAYESADVPRDGGATVRDTGKGLNIYRREADGRWRVARDAWNSDLAPAGE